MNRSSRRHHAPRHQPRIRGSLGQRFLSAGTEERTQIAASFDAGNLYLGNVIGEFIGELSLCLWFFLIALGAALLPSSVSKPRAALAG